MFFVQMSGLCEHIKELVSSAIVATSSKLSMSSYVVGMHVVGNMACTPLLLGETF